MPAVAVQCHAGWKIWACAMLVMCALSASLIKIQKCDRKLSLILIACKATGEKTWNFDHVNEFSRSFLLLPTYMGELLYSHLVRAFVKWLWHSPSSWISKYTEGFRRSIFIFIIFICLILIWSAYKIPWMTCSSCHHLGAFTTHWNALPVGPSGPVRKYTIDS